MTHKVISSEVAKLLAALSGAPVLSVTTEE